MPHKSAITYGVPLRTDRPYSEDESAHALQYYDEEVGNQLGSENITPEGAGEGKRRYEPKVSVIDPLRTRGPNKNGRVVGNNKTGQAGKRICVSCRRHRQKVSASCCVLTLVRV